MVLEKKRGVLLISNSFVKGKEFYNILVKDHKKILWNILQEDDKKTIEQNLDKGKIIVANIVGRGIEIKISEELKYKEYDLYKRQYEENNK